MRLALSKRAGNEMFFFPGSQYTCLLQQYGEGMRLLLDEQGISDLEVLDPSLENFFSFLGMAGGIILWRGLVAIDLLIKAACEKRPYEIHKGQTDRVHWENLMDIERGLAERNFSGALSRCVKRLESIRIEYEPRPLVGMAGDIYTRQNPAGNHDLFLVLEELGCEVWPAPFLTDGVDFGLRKTLHYSVQRRRFQESASVGLLYLKKELEKWKVKKNLRGAGAKFREPTFREIIEWTAPYIGLENNDTLLLNVAKMVDFAQRGADGVINAICFNCMLGDHLRGYRGTYQEGLQEYPHPDHDLQRNPDVLREKIDRILCLSGPPVRERKRIPDGPLGSEFLMCVSNLQMG